MRSAPLPPDEESRLAELRDLRVLDTGTDPELDRITQAAADYFKVPIALISLIDKDRQWFKSRVGLTATETARDISFCGHAILEDETFIVDDSLLDERFADNPLVTGDPHVRFYAGTQLKGPQGHKLGTLCLIDSVPRALTDEEQRMLEVLGDAAQRALRDRWTKTQLQETEQFFALSLDLFCIVTPDGRFTRLNPAFAELLGYSMDELLAMPFYDLIPEEHLAASRAEIERLAAGGVTVKFENQFTCRNGERKDLLWSARSDRASGRIFAAARDITERKRREARLARLAEIVEASPNLIAAFSADGRIEHLNTAWRELWAESPERPLPTTMRELYTDESADILVREAIPTALADGSWSGEISVLDPSGAPVVVQQSILTHPTPEGQVGELLSLVAHDVTAYKEVERIKDEFISTVSHELRTPLTSIRGSLGLLEMGAMGELPERAMSMVTIANQSTDRLIRLINDVLDLEKMQAGHLTLQRSIEHLGPLVQEAVAGISGMAAEAEVTVIEEHPTADLLVDIDRDRMIQVITNLLSNAVKFSQAGGTVLVRTLGPTADGLVRIQVQDTGLGIPPDRIHHIFERFAQVESATTRTKGGTGLGLAIVRDIVALHGGTVEVTSEVGVGSTFVVSLPVAGSEEPVSTTGDEATRLVSSTIGPESAGGRAPEFRARLLIVEDDRQLAQVMTALLEGAGHEVRCVASLQEGRSEIRAWVPDLVLLDLHLPDGNGLDLLPMLTSEPELAGIGVVVVTGSDDAPEALRTPVIQDWVRKPMGNRALLAKVEQALAGTVVPRVLIVEDDRLTREVLAVMLERAHIAVSQAANGQEALALLAETRYDLIILDLEMPVMDGYELVAELSAHGGLQLPVIVYSGEEVSREDEARFVAGITTFLTKTRTSDAQIMLEVRRSLGLTIELEPLD